MSVGSAQASPRLGEKLNRKMNANFQLLPNREKPINEPAVAGSVLRRECVCGTHTSGGSCSACSGKARSTEPEASQSYRRDARSEVQGRQYAAGTDFARIQAYGVHNHGSSSKNLPSDFDGGGVMSRGGTIPYREATELTECLRIMGPENAAYCRQQVLGEKPRPCSEANKAERLKACIQPVVIADDDGKNPTVAPPFNQVTSIWSKCCIDYTINAAKTVNKTAYKTLEESATNTPSAEESALFQDAGASTCTQVFVPATFSQGADTGKQISGGAGTYFRGTANPKVVVVEGAVSEVVAHEVGHASGFAGHEGAGETVMKGTNAHDVPNPHAVSTEVCTRARTGSVLTKTGAAKDCCINPA